jgi:hypothetical protein
MVRKWRLLRKRELDIEPFKIFQNKTLCEVIRKRRNDKNWGASTDLDAVSKDFLTCWGIGKRKVLGCDNSNEGFAHELQKVMQNPEIAAKLEESAKLANMVEGLRRSEEGGGTGNEGNAKADEELVKADEEIAKADEELARGTPAAS